MALVVVGLLREVAVHDEQGVGPGQDLVADAGPVLVVLQGGLFCDPDARAYVFKCVCKREMERLPIPLRSQGPTRDRQQWPQPTDLQVGALGLQPVPLAVEEEL